MDDKPTQSQVERWGKLLLLPLTDVNVALSARNLLVHLEKAVQKASEGDGGERAALRETEAALKDFLTIVHAASGAWLAGLEAGGPENSGPLQEAEVEMGKPKPRKRSKRAASDKAPSPPAQEGTP